MWILGLALTSTTCSGSLLHVAANGSYDSSTSSSFFTSPNGIWTLSFNIDSNPSVFDVSPGDGFATATSNLNYTLNDLLVPVGGLLTLFIREVPLAGGGDRAGGFLVCFSGDCGGHSLFFAGQTMYSGSEAAPTILPGLYPVSILVSVNGMVLDQPSSVLSISAIPEPSTLLLFPAMILIFGLATGKQGSGRRDESRAHSAHC
jgi:hypothetical protein